jgi:hypothetical protein
MSNFNLSEFWIDLHENPLLYEVSNFGQIRNKKRKKILKPHLHNGYLVVLIKDLNNKKIKRKVHRLVYYSFYPHANKKNDVHHIDKNKTNNEISNLQDLPHDLHAKMEKNLLVYGIATRRGKKHSSFKYTIAGFCCFTGELKYIFNGCAEVKAAGLNDSYVYYAVGTKSGYSKRYNLIFKKILNDSDLVIGNIYEMTPQIKNNAVPLKSH